MVRLIEYSEASAEIRAIYDDIMTTRGTDWINNFWKALANDPATLRRTWESLKEVMAPGARSLDQGADLSGGQRHQFLRLLQGA
jgi:hypothetical protein